MSKVAIFILAETCFAKVITHGIPSVNELKLYYLDAKISI